MYGSNFDAGNVHGDLGDAIVLNVPANSLGAFQSTGNHNGIAFLVLHYLAAGFATFALRTTFFTNIEGHGIGTAGAGSVEVVVDGNEEVASSNLSGASLCHMVVPLVGTKIGLPLFTAETAAEALVLTGTAVC